MILNFLRKVPAGMMIIPLLIGAFMNTFFPQALQIGSFTTATFSNAGSATAMGIQLFCLGTTLQLGDIPRVIKRGGILLISKFLIGAAIGIFVGKTWCVNYMFKADGKTAAFTDEEKETIDSNRENYCIVFGQETFNAKSGDFTFGGKWSVDGKKHTIHFEIEGNIVPPDPISNKFVGVIKEATKYEGDYEQLRIYTSANTSILFRPLK